MGFDMTDQQAESERRRKVRMELAGDLTEPMQFAIAADLQTEAALIALFINAILTNQTHKLLEVLRTTKPGA